jgi:hypothetical protein
MKHKCWYLSVPVFLCIIIQGLLLEIPSVFAGQIFSWSVENAPLGEFSNSTPNKTFKDINKYGGVKVHISDDVAHSGSKSIRITYPNDEAGVELKVPPFSGTKSLYRRSYEYFSPEWEGNWPKGLKIGRWFTTSDYSRCSSCPYLSEKLWQGNCDTSSYISGTNYAIKDQDCKWSLDETFGNGKNYIRTGHWYKFEVWMVMDSKANNVNSCSNSACDGVLKMWVDNVLVYSSESFCWHRTPDGTTTDFNWESGWFGGNYSGSTCGDPNKTLYRYIDDVYVSTTLDRDGDTAPVPTPPDESRPIPPENLRIIN